MNLKLAFVAASLALLGAPAAQAQLSIVLDSPVQAASAPELLGFNGTITNIGNVPIMLGSESLSAAAGIGTVTINTDLLMGTWPVVLGPGEFFRGEALFALDIPAGWTDSFGGTYAAFGEDDAGNPYEALVDYRVTIQGTAPVPEPGTMALLVGSLVGGSLLMKRRRK